MTLSMVGLLATLSRDTQNKSNVCPYAEYDYAKCCYAECYHAECHYAECCYTECRYAECHYSECHYAECLYTESRCALLLSFSNYLSLLFIRGLTNTRNFTTFGENTGEKL